ncbi:DUF2461 domain-containing protein [Intestinibacillus sp. Marseille-P6563]|uniref:DUF2461 domain-containing protein n=1 Tax=Intestinibacillus sp. Marseille-P6563 TaxID=2364792 RepID=UPI0013DFDCEB|nr:DUF2461 domain-containing protein [Intestinibacillus sp. Marseille-P6563]
MKELEFTGFDPQGLDLLIENRLMNSKDFYEAHKAEIRQRAVEPFHALCQRMAPAMLEIDPLFVTVPSRMVSRVRRDTRYTKDKTLYRANLWLFFRRPKMQYETVPFYYMEVTPDYWGYGCYGGFSPAEMALAREMIVQEDKLFLDAYQAAKNCPEFTLDGELYKRPRVPDAPEAYQPWLNRKHLGLQFSEYNDYSPLWDGSFVEPMLESFRRIAPFYRFVAALYERTRGNEAVR